MQENYIVHDFILPARTTHTTRDSRIFSTVVRSETYRDPWSNADIRLPSELNGTTGLKTADSTGGRKLLTCG